MSDTPEPTPGAGPGDESRDDALETQRPAGSTGGKDGTGRTSSTGLDTKLAGMLCYLFVFVSGAVFLIVEEIDRDVRFHAYQSTLTFGFLFVLSGVASWVPWFGWVIGLVIWPFIFVLWLVLMWKAFEGERFKLPVVGEWAAEQADRPR